MLPIKILNTETGETTFRDLATGTGILKENEVALFAIGIADQELTPLYQGDLVTVDIKTKYGIVQRCGVIRTDAFIACGIDYINDEGLVEEDGDFIEDFYLTDIRKISTIFEIDLVNGFDWHSFVEEMEEQ